MTRANVFHIVAQGDWDFAMISGVYAPRSLAADGFIHLSHKEQVAPVANEWYPELTDLIVVELDPTLLAVDLVDEDLYGKGETFPHLYAPMPTTAVLGVHPLPRGADGKFYFPS